jgi:hypothetical protein
MWSAFLGMMPSFQYTVSDAAEHIPYKKINVSGILTNTAHVMFIYEANVLVPFQCVR